MGCDERHSVARLVLPYVRGLGNVMSTGYEGGLILYSYCFSFSKSR